MDKIIENQPFEKWMNEHLLFIGIAGCGKTYAIQHLLPVWLANGKKIGIVDFRDEYEEITENLGGVSIDLRLLKSKEQLTSNQLLRFHYGNDIYYMETNTISLNGLDMFPDDLDWLIVDDAHAFHQHAFQKTDHQSIALKLQSLKERYPKTRLVTALLGTYDLTEVEKRWVKQTFPHPLLFRLYHLDILSLDILSDRHSIHFSLEKGESFVYDETHTFSYYYNWRNPTFLR